MILPLQFIGRKYDTIRSIGMQSNLERHQKRRLTIFNQLNFFGLITGIITPIIALLNGGVLPSIALVVACAPAIISSLVLIANSLKWYRLAMACYFILHPLTTSLVYAGNIDAGVELYFILYGVLSVFFLQQLHFILLSIFFSTLCYLTVFVTHKEFDCGLEQINFTFFFMNHLVSVIFIFLGLFLIKSENAAYQREMEQTNRELSNRNRDINQQRQEISNKAELLEQQTDQLMQLNSIKNRLFSIISHDIRTPLYSLRNLFRNIHQYDLPGDEVKVLVPDIINDLNYTTGLMENLLQWAKSQMQGNTINLQLLDISNIVKEVQQLVRLQAENKQIYLESKLAPETFIYADKDMINLVLRNLLSNAIKFTPPTGSVTIDTVIENGQVLVHVTDTGRGISKENMKLLFTDQYFSTKGTNNESGTGLGLIMCKEFLEKNGGRLDIQSEEGKGSVFTIQLPKA